MDGLRKKASPPLHSFHPSVKSEYPMKLYRPYTLISSSRLNGDYDVKDIRIDWVCYMRDKPLLPFPQLLEDYPALKNSQDNLAWIIERVNNFLSGEEVEELTRYLEQKYGFSVEVEAFKAPLKVSKLTWFKESYIDSAIILRDIDEPFCLSVSILGMVSPIKDLDSVRTVNEFLEEIDRQNGQ